MSNSALQQYLHTINIQQNWHQYIELCHSGSRGRYIVAKKFIPAGTVLFTEQSIVNNDISTINSAVLNTLHHIADTTQYDVTRLIQVYNLLQSTVKRETDIATDSADVSLLDIVNNLSTSNLCDRRHTMEQQRYHVAQHLYNTCIDIQTKNKTSIEQINHILNVLDNNVHEIAMLNHDTRDDHVDLTVTDGLFPLLACFNHSCIENCAFTALDHTCTVSVSTIVEISVGDELCVNYIHRYYPTSLRQSYLQYNYAFQCTCTCCIGTIIDKSRAFNCIKCTDGIVYQSDTQYHCSNQSCAYITDVNTVKLYNIAERAVIDMTGVDESMMCIEQLNESTDIDIDQIVTVVGSIGESIVCDQLASTDIHSLYVLLHRSHYGMNAAINIIADQMTASDRYHGAIAMTWLLIDNLDTLYGVDTMHWRKAIEYDRLAYLYTNINDIDRAKQALEYVYKINKTCFSTNSAVTKIAHDKLLQLAEVS